VKTLAGGTAALVHGSTLNVTMQAACLLVKSTLFMLKCAWQEHHCANIFALTLVAHFALVALTLTLVAFIAFVAMSAFAWMRPWSRVWPATEICGKCYFASVLRMSFCQKLSRITRIHLNGAEK
jgi:hypothetical protein